MSVVYYKFKSSNEFDTVTFDGIGITLADFRKSIYGQKKLGKPSELDEIQVKNAQTQEEYVKEDDMIPRNASVIISRVPVGGIAKTSAWKQGSDSPYQGVIDQMNYQDFQKLTETADLSSAAASEEDKIRAMMVQSTKDYDSSNYQRSRLPHGGYTCFKCGKPGHFIQNCPHRADRTMWSNHRVKNPTGIPESFLTNLDNPSILGQPGVMRTASGRAVVPTMDAMAYQKGKVERPPFAPRKKSPPRKPKPEEKIPTELLCQLCNDILNDAVVIPCCGNSYCDECVRDALLATDDHICPGCKEIDVSPDKLIANQFLRKAVMNFKNEAGYTKQAKEARAKKEESPPPPPPPPRPNHASKPKIKLTTKSGSVPSSQESQHSELGYPSPVTSSVSLSQSSEEANASPIASLAAPPQTVRPVEPNEPYHRNYHRHHHHGQRDDRYRNNRHRDGTPPEIRRDAPPEVALRDGQPPLVYQGAPPQEIHYHPDTASPHSDGHPVHHPPPHGAPGLPPGIPVMPPGIRPPPPRMEIVPHPGLQRPPPSGAFPPTMDILDPMRGAPGPMVFPQLGPPPSGPLLGPPIIIESRPIRPHVTGMMTSGETRMMSEDEFYRTQHLMRHKKTKPGQDDQIDEFARELKAFQRDQLQRKMSRSRSRSRSKGRSKKGSKGRTRSRSFTRSPKKKRSRTKSFSRSRSRSRAKKPRSRSRSKFSRSRSRTRSFSPGPRPRSISRSRSRSRSRGRRRPLSRSRSLSRAGSWTPKNKRLNSFSRSPSSSKRRSRSRSKPRLSRSRSRSRRRFSRSRSRSKPRNKRSRSRSKPRKRRKLTRSRSRSSTFSFSRSRSRSRPRFRTRSPSPYRRRQSLSPLRRSLSPPPFRPRYRRSPTPPFLRPGWQAGRSPPPFRRGGGRGGGWPPRFEQPHPDDQYNYHHPQLPFAGAQAYYGFDQQQFHEYQEFLRRFPDGPPPAGAMEDFMNKHKPKSPRSRGLQRSPGRQLSHERGRKDFDDRGRRDFDERGRKKEVDDSGRKDKEKGRQDRGRRDGDRGRDGERVWDGDRGRDGEKRKEDRERKEEKGKDSEREKKKPKKDKEEKPGAEKENKKKMKKVKKGAKAGTPEKVLKGKNDSQGVKIESAEGKVTRDEATKVAKNEKTDFASDEIQTISVIGSSRDRYRRFDAHHFKPRASEAANAKEHSKSSVDIDIKPSVDDLKPKVSDDPTPSVNSGVETAEPIASLPVQTDDLQSLEGGSISKRKVDQSPEGQPPLKQVKAEPPEEANDKPIDMFEDENAPREETVSVLKTGAAGAVKLKKPKLEADGAPVKVRKKKMKIEKLSGTDTDGDNRQKKVKTKVRKREKLPIVDDSESKVSSTDDFVKVKKEPEPEDYSGGREHEKRVRQYENDGHMKYMKEGHRSREMVKEKHQALEKVRRKEKVRSSKEKQLEPFDSETVVKKKHRPKKELPPVDMEEMLPKKKKHEHGSKKTVKIPKQTVLREPSPDLHLEDEPELGEEAIMVDPPELSKWEKEELYGSDIEPRRFQRRGQGKMMLPRSVIESAEKTMSNKPHKGMMSAVSMVTSPVKTAPSVVQVAKPAEKKGKTVRRVFIDDGTGERVAQDKKREHRHSQDYTEDPDKGDLRKTINIKRDLREKLNERKSGGDDDDDRYGGSDDLVGLESDIVTKKKEKKISMKRDVSMEEQEKRGWQAERASQESDSGDIRLSTISSSRQIERKVSLLDEANFEPDYNESDSASSQSPARVKSSSKRSPSEERHREKKHKHKKHKKHKHKHHKKHKHKHDKEQD
ncbi:E3 ubiquitin-protein ligase RBBP6-like [Lineus longissimus]|uniref:E3 ubiquitin-protein ligase RBBP6-like n=1 Tax=Lineus longissimus TaxID=88925 RepID=UPI00315D4D65